VREGVLWFLRRGLDGVVGVQRGMVEKRIERAREKEKSVLYKSASTAAGAGVTKGGDVSVDRTMDISTSSVTAPDATVLSEAETARIEAQLSPEQLQLFAEENDTMLRHYEDTLGKVQYVFPLLPFFRYHLTLHIPWLCISFPSSASATNHITNHHLETPKNPSWKYPPSKKPSSPISPRRRSMSRN
jgi:hypothetical protein